MLPVLKQWDGYENKNGQSKTHLPVLSPLF